MPMAVKMTPPATAPRMRLATPSAVRFIAFRPGVHSVYAWSHHTPGAIIVAIENGHEPCWRLALCPVVQYRYGMKRRFLLLVIVLVAAGLIAITAGHTISSEKVYTLAEVQQGRLIQSAAWAGRTVLVRAQLVGMGATWGIIVPAFRFPACGLRPRSIYVLQPSSLVVVAATGNLLHTHAPRVIRETLLGAVLSRVACLPVIGGLVPASAVEYGMTLRIRFVPKRQCAALFSSTCPDAVLLQMES